MIGNGEGHFWSGSLFLFGSRRTPERVGDFLGNLPGGQIRGENDGVGMHNLLVHSSVKC